MSLIYVRSDHASEWVDLTEFQLRAGLITGKWVWEKSHADGRQDVSAGITAHADSGLRHQCLGSLCEEIAAKCLGVYNPRSVDVFHEPDLGASGVEVKLIGVDHYGLRIYDHMPDCLKVVGVVVPMGEERSLRYRVAGWVFAGEAKRDEWKMAPNGGRPMYAAPQASLRPVSSLRVIVLEEALERADPRRLEIPW